MSAPIFSATPANVSERYLARLCQRSFLRLWSWPNVYRDQGPLSVGKEVCDLLVVFGKHIFIFSDKHCAFPNSGDFARDWGRWHRRAVLKSAAQVIGAERWIRAHPDRLFLDPSCTERFPLPLPTLDEAIYHRIVVAHGSRSRCQGHLGGSGSLMLAPNESQQSCTPFMLGHLDGIPGYVHVLDDLTFDTILRTLDTVADLAQYFQRKEELISSGKLLMAAGEEDLLAYYLQHVDADGRHNFEFDPSFTGIFIDEGSWDSFSRHPDRLSQIEADRISYVWDQLIDDFAKNIIEDTQYFASSGTLDNLEPALRFMAAEPRLHRRMLAGSLSSVLERANKEWRASSCLEAKRPRRAPLRVLGAGGRSKAHI